LEGEYIKVMTMGNIQELVAEAKAEERREL
jgi:hypothetical protein